MSAAPAGLADQLDWMYREEYRHRFERFVKGKLAAFYEGLEPVYLEWSGQPDCLVYARAHFVRFWAMINLVLKGVPIWSPARIAEVGSFLPYTSFYWVSDIDLYDIVPLLYPTAKPYDVGGVRLTPFNVAKDEFPADRQYDLVVLSEVMEHLPTNLFDLERKIVGVLAPGGYLVATYPMHGHNAKDYDQLVGDPDKSYAEHLREFTEDTVPLFFRQLEKITQGDVVYPAYGHIRMVLYKRPA